MMQRSSITDPRWGKTSLTSVPLCPYFSNVNGDRIRLPTLRSWDKGPPGIGWPSYFVSVGLGSKLSTCDKPPFMNRKITRFAFGLKLGLSISQGAGPFVDAALATELARAAKLIIPKPAPILQ